VPEADFGFEFMMNALRLTGGFEEALFKERTGQPVALIAGELRHLASQGLLIERSGHWQPSPRGFQYLNELVARFLPAGAQEAKFTKQDA
jgi:coproporphyrinogen III oxidase-like Fe-S oxidoreductase